MDLLSITRILWRHKLLVLPVVVLTFVGVLYVAAFEKPLYESTIDYVFVPPPGAPTAAQIAQNPALGSVNSQNVFSRFYDQSIIADSIVSRMSSQPVQQALVNAGADGRNTITPISLYGSPEPMVEVTGTGSSAAEATKTRTLVSTSLEHNLFSLQREQGTNPMYMFTALQVASSPPQIKFSSTLRSMVGVLGAGVVLLFVLVSVGDAIDKKRAEVRSRQVAHLDAHEQPLVDAPAPPAPPARQPAPPAPPAPPARQPAPPAPPAPPARQPAPTAPQPVQTRPDRSAPEPPLVRQPVPARADNPVRQVIQTRPDRAAPQPAPQPAPRQPAPARADNPVREPHRAPTPASAPTRRPAPAPAAGPTRRPVPARPDSPVRQPASARQPVSARVEGSAGTDGRVRPQSDIRPRERKDVGSNGHEPKVVVGLRAAATSGRPSGSQSRRSVSNPLGTGDDLAQPLGL